MSNFEKLVQLYKACEKFEQQNILLEEFKLNIMNFGSALEGLDNDLYDFIEECEIVLKHKPSVDHYTLGLKVSEKLKMFLSSLKNINNM